MSNSALPDLNVGTLFSQEGKVVVITGGGTGLGLMMATAFVQNGAKGKEKNFSLLDDPFLSPLLA